MGCLQRLEDIKSIIRALLIAENSENITLCRLNKLYKEETGDDIPYLEYHYTSLREFLINMPDVLDLRYNKRNELFVYHKNTEKSKHIASLVARQKKSLPDRRSRSYLIERNNRIDLYLLQDVLNESAVCSPQNGNNKISKIDVLSRILKRLGQYSFYNLKNLNHQLNEYTHLLSHDDDHIYLKQKLTKNPAKRNVLCQVASNFGDLNRCNVRNSLERERFPRPVWIDSVSDFVRDPTKQQLKALMEKHPDGILCTDLPKQFKKEFKWDLEYNDIGFSSIVEFVDALPEIFVLVADPNTQQLLVVNNKSKSASQDCFSGDSLNHLNLITSSENVDPITQLLPHQVSRNKKLPLGQMNCGENLRIIPVRSLILKNGIDVIVSDGINPSRFWITLRKYKNKLNKLMDNLRYNLRIQLYINSRSAHNQLFQFLHTRKFYSSPKNSKIYTVPVGQLKPGLYVACKFAEMWHRSVVKRIKGDGRIVVYFCDYGQKAALREDEIFFLDRRFSSLPIQALPCNLVGVRPIHTNDWSKDVSKKFIDKILNKTFTAIISDVNEKRNSMSIHLIHGSSGMRMDVWLVTNQLAEYGNAPGVPDSVEN
ncbi:hypothetical protein QAD02_018066 [Eretmocerus hayati]|uniref:Uncharacterized protein n=1 Tax=Eretmocerus hayati TaxID=131215 RepID=A0ACC2PG46_9HYME|nr:hypothetical protein QAD02_018066 [Eretmocerus hayati]